MNAVVGDFQSLGQPAVSTGRAFRKNTLEVDKRCMHCEGDPVLVDGDVIYPHRPDLAHKKFWNCAGCNAFVGCHPPKDSERGGVGDGTVALGRPANADLRKLRTNAHATFDPMFRDARGVSRRDAYGWLAGQLGIKASACHIGQFDVGMCQRVLAVMDAHWTSKPSMGDVRRRA